MPPYDDKDPPCDCLFHGIFDHPWPDRRNRGRGLGAPRNCPSGPATTSISSSKRSGVTSSNSTRSAIELCRASGRFGGHLARLFDRFFDCAERIEGALSKDRKCVV